MTTILTDEQYKVLKAMRKYHKCLNDTIERYGEDEMARRFPFFDRKEFPKSLHTNEKLQEWIFRQADEIEANHLFSGQGSRISCMDRNRNYGTVCSVMAYVLTHEILKVEEHYDIELQLNSIEIETADYYVRVTYNGKISGFLYVETLRKSNQRLMRNPYAPR